MFTRCPFCHRWVLTLLLERHKSKHVRVGADGQQEDHVTVPPDARYEGSLDGIPQAYRHPKCGASTGMPDEIIRSYLVNPFLYNEYSFCTGCGDYVHTSELFWRETGQSLFDYTKQLQSEFIREHGGPPTQTGSASSDTE